MIVMNYYSKEIMPGKASRAVKAAIEEKGHALAYYDVDSETWNPWTDPEDGPPVVVEEEGEE